MKNEMTCKDQGSCQKRLKANSITRAVIRSSTDIENARNTATSSSQLQLLPATKSTVQNQICHNNTGPIALTKAHIYSSSLLNTLI